MWVFIIIIVFLLSHYFLLSFEGILSCLCMEFPEFRAIVRKKHFIATCLTEEGKSLPVTWKNTN